MEKVIPKATVLRPWVDGAKTSVTPANGMLTVAEACEYLRISRWTLYRLIHEGRLKTLKIGSRRLIRMQSIMDFVEKLESAVRV